MYNMLCRLLKNTNLKTNKMKVFKNVMMAALVLLTTHIFAQTAPVDDNGLAIGGYDVVSYFSEGATMGKKSISTTHDGATYYFSTKENMKMFKADPDKYLPQYGGFCAWGVAEKESMFPINPETYDIVDGKLYFFFDGDFKGKPLNTMLPWNEETSKLKEMADKNWKAMKKTK